jgi:surface antigen
MIRNLLMIFAIAVFGIGCAEQPSKETVGTGAGAAIGGVVGSQIGDGTTGTVVGGVVGALLGREIGRRMHEQDRQNARTAFEENRTVSWDNPDTQTQYTVEPTDTYRNEQGRVCRKYNPTIRVEGDRETATGTACRRPDRTWEIVS